MRRKKMVVLLPLFVFFAGFCCASAASPARLVSVLFSNLFSALLRRLWAATSDSRIAISSHSIVRFESGYSVDTVFDGSKHGIEPFSVEVTPGGELLILDSENSNIYKVSLPLSKYNRPKLVAGSTKGSSGHVDGKPHEARMNRPTGLTVDGKGNIYVADTKNKAIRKISDTGVTTIAAGKSYSVGRITLQIKDATFSDDFEVVYVSNSCSLLVVDRGNHAIREIQLNLDDCADQYGAGLSLGIAVLFAGAFFGYMLALLQWRWTVVASPSNDRKTTTTRSSTSPCQQPIKSSLRPPLIPPETETGRQEEEEEGFFDSLKELIASSASSLALIFNRIFSSRRTLKDEGTRQEWHEENVQSSQECFPVADEPPPLEIHTHIPCKTYAFMSNDPEKLRQLRHDTAYFDGWSRVAQSQRCLQKHRQCSSGSETYYGPSSKMTEETVFGAVQESGSRHDNAESSSVKHGDPPQTYCKPISEMTDEIVFGAVQESGSRRDKMEECVKHGDPSQTYYKPISQMTEEIVFGAVQETSYCKDRNTDRSSLRHRANRNGVSQ